MNQVVFEPGNIAGNGAGQTIAIVIWGDNTSLQPTGANFTGSALDVFDKAFGLPAPPSFTIYNQNGQSAERPIWARAMRSRLTSSTRIRWPRTPTSTWSRPATASFGALGQAIYSAAAMLDASVVSMSWGAPSNVSVTVLMSHISIPSRLYPALAVNPNVTFLSSTGDNSASVGASYPAVSPYVVGVGGTVLSVAGLSPNYTYVGETGWADGGRRHQYLSYDEPSLPEYRRLQQRR